LKTTHYSSRVYTFEQAHPEFTKTALPKFADRTIVPIVEQVFSIDDVVAAHRMMEEDKHFGKIVLKIQE
jgi:NADPH:quinone reductase-like Zn-dependent oxidoreductase